MANDKEICKRLKEQLTQRTKQGVAAQRNGYFNAAVLVPLVQHEGELSVLFEVRSSKLSWQPGEICFPGGRIELQDQSVLAAAIRETSEELGVSADKIEVLGAMDEIIASIGVLLYPAVGYIAQDSALQLSRDEVDEIFTVPLSFLVVAAPTTALMELGTRPMANFPFELFPNGYSSDWKKRSTHSVLFYQYQQRVIWGLTAQVLHDFLENYKKII